MLILAGVSLNAIIGDNGIITNAQSASFKSGMAALEEYLQEKYVEYYDESENYANKPELLGDKIDGLLLTQGQKKYITSTIDGEGVKKYYLINKSVLPKEIKDGLSGGNAEDYADYINFIDVYGVTEDLKVYYCENGLTETIFGNVEGTAIKSETPSNKINSDSGIKTAVSNALGLDVDSTITIGDVQSLKALTLNNSSISSLGALSEIYNLKNLTLENLTLTDLSGLESCTLLETIYFKNTTVGNYNALCSNYKLTSLYMYLNPNWSEEVCNNQVTNLCNGLSNASKLSNLTRFGISGSTDLLENTSSYRTSYYEKNNNITSYEVSASYFSLLSSIMSFSNINKTVRNAIVYLYLNNNSLTSIDYLEGFGNVEYLAIMNNGSLTSLEGISECTQLKYLFGHHCYNEQNIGGSVTYTGLTDISDLNNCSYLNSVYLFKNRALSNLTSLTSASTLKNLYAYGCNLTDITGINGLTGLEILSLYSNVRLVHISSLGSLSGLKELYLANNTAMDLDEVLAALDDSGILAGCGSNYSIPSYYTDNFTCLVGEYILSNQGLTDDSDIIQKFLTRADVTNVKRLNLTGNSELTDDTLQTMLKRMKSLQVLCLRDCTKLESINFISEGNVTDLYELDLRGTNVTDLSNLNNYAKNLVALILNNYSTDFSKIQTTINKLAENWGTYDQNLSFYRETIYNAHCNGLILTGDASNYVFGENCSSISAIYMGQGKFKDLQTGELDLSELSGLRDFKIRYAGYSVVLPSGLEIFEHSSGNFSCDLSSCNSLVSVSEDDYDASYMYTELSSLTKMPSTLDIQRLGVTSLGFLTQENAKSLNTLKLGYGVKDSCQLADISALEYATNLKNLTLRGLSKLQGLDTLVKLSNLQSLIIQSLLNDYISSVPLGTDTLQLSKLEQFWLTGCENINRVSGLDKISSLKDVSIHDTGLVSVSGLSNHTGLTSLSLFNNQISDLSEFDTLINNCENNKVKFTSLNLSNNSIDFYASNGNDNAQTILNLKAANVTSINVKENNVANSPKLAGISGIKVGN